MFVFFATAVVFILTFCLIAASRAVPAAELRRRARGGKDSKAEAVYKMVSYQPSLDILLTILAGASLTVVILSGAEISWWLTGSAIATSGWLILRLRTRRSSGLAWTVGAALAAPAAWVLSYLHPLLRRLGALTGLKARSHTGAYDREDLLEIVKSQGQQVDNRVSESDLRMIAGALTFGDKTVGSIMTPRRKIKMVEADEPIGPHVMDELHASGFSRFPVVKDNAKSSNPEIVGTLYLKDLVGHSQTGRVKDVARDEVYYINEAQSLRDALGVFLKTQHHLLVVINNFEEIVGILSMDDVINQIMVDISPDEFEHYDDLKAVAGLEASSKQPLSGSVVE